MDGPWKIHKTNVDALKRELPAKGQKFYWDCELKGFGVKTTPSGILFVVQRKISGKTIRHIIGKSGEINCDDARKKAARALAELRDGTNLNQQKRQKQAESMSLKEAYDKFMKAKKHRPRTVQTYDENINRCLPDWLDLPLASITKDMVEERHKELSNKHGPRGKGEASANQAMRLLRVVVNYVNFTHEEETGLPLLPINPVNRLSHPQKRLWNKIERRQDVISVHDLPKWYAVTMKIDSGTVRDYLLLCLFTGLRRTEAMKLRWSNIKFTEKTLKIPKEDAKNGDEHTLPLTDFLIELLEQRSKIPRIDTDYVFASEDRSGHIVEPKRSIATVVKRSEVKFSMHTLRRTFATTAERLNVPYYSLKRLLNHRVKNDVTAGYVVTEVDLLREPMQRITDCLKRGLGISNQPSSEGRSS